jgi:hypothetical protein
MRSLAFQLPLLGALLLTSGCGDKNEEAKETNSRHEPALASTESDPPARVEREKEALPAALTQLRTQFSSGAPTLVKVKIVRVTLSEDTAQAELQVHLADGQLQVNAIWETKWTTEEDPVLRALEARMHAQGQRHPGRLHQLRARHAA